MKNKGYTALPYKVQELTVKTICQKAVENVLLFRRDTGASSKRTRRQAVKNHEAALDKLKKTVIEEGEGNTVQHYIMENERDILKGILMTLDFALATLEEREKVHKELDYVDIVDEAVKSYYAKYGSDAFDIEDVMLYAEMILSQRLGMSKRAFYTAVDEGDESVIFHLDRVVDTLLDVYRGDFDASS